MASIVNYQDGLKRIEFTRDGKAYVVRLGRVNADVARFWLDKVDAILADQLAHRPHTPEVSGWLGRLDERMLARLRAAGLADGVGLASVTLGAFLQRYADAMTAKPATITFYGHTRRNLAEYFGAGRPLRSITPADADAWRAWLTTHEQLAPATVARRVIAARTLWRKAVRWNLAGLNPFDGIRAGHQENESRKQFVTRETIERLMSEAPDTEWRLIIALSRYAGLRFPSETFALRWGDVNFADNRIVVRSSKTEHHEGGSSRIVPLFAELRPYLQQAFDEAEAGTLFVVNKHRIGSENLRTTFTKIIRRAGLVPWPRLFQNLRASRESELMREYDLATVCRWVGNSPAIAAKHYAMSVDLDADFRRASGPAPDEKETEKGAGKSVEVRERHELSEIDRKGATADCARLKTQSDNSRQLHVSACKISDWAMRDSNPRLPPCKGGALAN